MNYTGGTENKSETFCMCPGGEVVTLRRKGMMALNGMSWVVALIIGCHCRRVIIFGKALAG